MKGVLLSINSEVRLLDLTHGIPPQDLQFAGYFLRHCLTYFPAGTLHLVVVDPGVGSNRALLYVEVAGQRLVVPDNGCWTPLGEATCVRRLENASYWRHPVSNTFHGRDILAPVAGHLSLGLDPAQLGPVATTWVRLPWPLPQCTATEIRGEVLFIDHFGNLITNIPAEWLPASSPSLRIVIGEHEVLRWCLTYAEAQPGELIALGSSGGLLEIAVAQGNAAKLLQPGNQSPVRVDLRETQAR